MSDDYELDFDELRKIYRQEKNSSRLYNLNNDFYKALKKFISQEKKLYLEALESMSQQELKKFENLKKMVLKIRELRLKKSLNLCLIYSRTNEVKEDNLVDFESDFVKGVLKLMEKQVEYTNNLFGVKKKKENVTQKLIKAKVLQSIPAFIGTDMKEYDPFEKGDTCEIPKEVYDILSSKQIVEDIK
jgi:DNA replication initiation complex subunit (GINS family)